MDAAVQVADLVKRYPGRPTNAVDGISFTVERGEVFGLLGPNGAGKTTTIGVLFAAEWGDLSQLATAGLAARYDAPVSVFVGAWAALLTVSGLAVFLGRKLADRLPIALIRRVAAALFLVFAVFAVVETVRALS